MITVGALRVREDSATGPQKRCYFPVASATVRQHAFIPAILIVMTPVDAGSSLQAPGPAWTRGARCLCYQAC